MGYKFTEIWCNRGNFTEDSRTKADIKYIVIHYTGNNGDTAEDNCNYFKNNVVGASAHYFVDSTTVCRSIQDKNKAWHCGDDVYYHPHCRNSNSIGIEICGSTTNPTVDTIANLVELVVKKMKEYNIPLENVVRHYDVTHKLCPAYWCGSASKDTKWELDFKSKVAEALSNKPTASGLYRVGTGWKNGKCIEQKGAFGNLANARAFASSLNPFKIYDENGKEV